MAGELGMGRADVERLASPSVPPIEWRKKPSRRCGHVREETDRPQDEVIVVAVAVVAVVVAEYHSILKDNCCWTARFLRAHFASASYCKAINNMCP